MTAATESLAELQSKQDMLTNMPTNEFEGTSTFELCKAESRASRSEPISFRSGPMWYVARASGGMGSVSNLLTVRFAPMLPLW